jgi:hypothetical protein
MQGYINNNFVQASPNGGGLLSKIYGGIADAKREQTVADIRMGQHYQREEKTTEEYGKRQMLGVAAKDWGSEQEHGRHFTYTKQHHELAKEYGLKLAGYKGVNYQKEGNANRHQTSGQQTTPGGTGTPMGNTGGNTGSQPTGNISAPKKKDATIKDSEEASKLSRGVNGRKPKRSQTLRSSYIVGGKKVTEVKGSAPNLGIDQESLAAGSKGYAAKLGRNAAAKKNGVNGGNS